MLLYTQSNRELFRKKDKISHCVSVTDVLCSQGLKNSPESAKYLAMAMEMYFTLVDDQGGNVYQYDNHTFYLWK